MTAVPLYARRPVLNANEIIKWYKDQGFESLTVPEEMHVTTIFSRNPVEQKILEESPTRLCVPFVEGTRINAPLGDKGAIVLKFKSDWLQKRWERALQKGCSWDYKSYQPHITLTYSKPDVNLARIKPFQGEIVLGPEIFEMLVDNWRPVEKSEYCIEIPAIVKAHKTADGTRKISFEASNESVDSEGDLIKQAALLGSAEIFLRGKIDLDHLSEIGQRYGMNPNEFIVGEPVSVFDMGSGRTGVTGTLYKGNPHADKIWEDLNNPNAQPWRASIYGFPHPDGGLIDVRKASNYDNPHGATRFVVEKMIWRSIALTQSPVNSAITGNARIIKSSSFFARLEKAYGSYGTSYTSMLPSLTTTPVVSDNIDGLQAGDIRGPQGSVAPNALYGKDGDTAPASYAPLHRPRNRTELMGHFTHHIQKGMCKHNSLAKATANSVYSFREHFMNCCGCDYHDADMLALAMMHLLKHH